MSNNPHLASEIAKILGPILVQTVNPHDLDANLTEDYAANSMDIIDIVETIERHFGVRIRNDQIYELKTFGDLVSLVGHAKT